MSEPFTAAFCCLIVLLFVFHRCSKPVRISQAIHDPYAYTNLNDSIIFNILQSTLPELAAVRNCRPILIIIIIVITLFVFFLLVSENS